MAPFLTTVAGRRIKASHLADIDPVVNSGLPPLTPQVIGKSPDDLRLFLQAIRSLGYNTCDLNAGCPWPMIVKKGRGAGLMGDADNLRRMLDTGCSVMPGGFSIKVRLGLDSPDLLPQIMHVINDYPLKAITVHARTARQRYEGCVDLEGFAAALRVCRHPVFYNGDILTKSDFHYLREMFPGVAGWMIGRGAVIDPFLPSRLRAAAADETDTRCMSPPDYGADGDGKAEADHIKRLRAFLEEYYELSASELCGPAPLMGRIKELWSYLHRRFVDGDFLWKQIRTCRQPAAYQRILLEWWARPPSLAAVPDGIVLPSTLP